MSKMMKKDREKLIVAELVKSLTALRLAEGLSHNKLAMKAGVTRPAISQIESGKRKPTLVVCLKIARALDKNLGDIIAKCEKELEKK